MEYQKLYECLFTATRIAGIVADMMQATIVNEGKQVEAVEDEDERHLRMREAKTRADEIVQEILLQAVLPEYQAVLSLDVEEDTASRTCFLKQDYDYTLVLDPIDGTLDYLHQKDTWSICSAVLHEHEVHLAIVYFPKRDSMYTYVDGQGCRVYHQLKQCTAADGEVLSVQCEKIPSVIYKNSRLSEEIVQQLRERGFQVRDDSEQELGCPDAILACMKGEALAYFSDTRNIRDILLGAI
ncbi:MAG: inositol monophosphatase family protein, partial [[Clostridium] innocuum]